MTKKQHRIVCKLDLLSDVMKIDICFTVEDYKHNLSPREIQKVADCLSDAVNRALKEVPDFGGAKFTLTQSRQPY
jgi:hypothetical protein